MTSEIYLDGNATSTVLPAAMAAAVHAMGELYGNPSSTHASGLRARAQLDAVRQRARRLLGVGDGRLMFNSGATEGIQTAMLSALCALREARAAGRAGGDLLVYGATEHKAVPESLAHWNRLLGLDLQLVALAVDADGRHDLAQLRTLAPRAALLCTMAANNETGVISDLAGIEAVLADSGSAAYWLVDCVQALGKLEVNLAATRIDYAPFSGHKLYAPKGIGMLYVRAGAPFTPLLMGGGQEGGQRSGTENMAGIAALGAVLAALEDGHTFRSHAQLAGFRDRLAASLRDALPGVVFNTPFAKALPTTLNFSAPGLASKELLDLFDAAGVRVSSGSACSAAKAAPSFVLEAMQLPRWRSDAAIRMSFGPLVDEATIAAACARIARCGAALRSSGLCAPAARSADVAGAPVAEDGVLQFTADGACSWLLVDAASLSCVIVDPLKALLPRLAASVRQQGLHLAAILHTGALSERAATRRTVLLALSGHLAPDCQRELEQGMVATEKVARGRAGDHGLGWPGAAGAAVALADGTPCAAMAFGRQTVARVAHGPDGALYLLGAVRSGRLAPRFAFTGAADPAEIDAALLAGGTLICPAQDQHGHICSILQLEEGGLDDGAGAPLALAGAALADFLRQYPQALLVDVRESYEAAAGGAPGAPLGADGAHGVLSVPLSRLPGYLDGWLRAHTAPLVFFCRSGNRSQKAAACLRRLGHRHAYSVNGGMALGGAFLGAYLGADF